MTNRIMLDSVELSGMRGIPCDIVSYYLDLVSQSATEAMYPGKRYNPIDRRGLYPHLSRSLDVEEGCVWPPSKCESYIQAWNATNPAYKGGGRLVIYCNRSTISQVRTGTGRYVLGKDYYLWVATGDGSLYTGPGVIACQNIWSRTYDSSEVYSSAWMPS